GSARTAPAGLKPHSPDCDHGADCSQRGTISYSVFTGIEVTGSQLGSGGGMAVKAEDVAARLLAEFPHALRSGQVVTYFQPEVELASGRVVAAESLARWEHPELGTLSPVLFTPLATKLRLMRELTELILGLSLRQQRSWARSGWDIPVSVNVGPESVADPEFPAVIDELLRREQM